MNLRSSNNDNRVARPAWVVLIGGYLIVHGSVFVLGTVLSQLTEFGFGYYIRDFRDAHDWNQPWPWLAPCRVFFIFLVPFVALVAGICIARRPASLNRLAFPIAMVMLIPGVLGIAVWVNLQITWSFRLSRILEQLPTVMIPVLVLWCVRRVERVRRPEIAIIAAYLLIAGGFGAGAVAGSIVVGLRDVQMASFSFGGWTLPNMSFMAGRAFSFVLFLCGLVLLKRPGRIIAVAGVVLVAAIVRASLSVVQDHAGFANYSFLVEVDAALRGPVHSVVLALFLLVFAMRYRDRLGWRYPRCVACGYNLTGLTEPRCPECGTGFALPGDEGTRDRGEA